MTQSSVTEITVVRHGETVWNADGRQQGHLDSDLSPLGLQQAGAIADCLATREFDALYSSDLGRAFHTAEFIAQITGHEIVTDQRLRERNLGIFQGLTFAEVQQRYPAEYTRFISHDPDYVIPDGESIRQRGERAVGGIEEIASNHPGETVVIVAHGGVLSDLFRHALGIPLTEPRRYKLFNASINTFYVNNGNWMLGTWGDVHHLKNIGTIDDW